MIGIQKLTTILVVGILLGNILYGMNPRKKFNIKINDNNFLEIKNELEIYDINDKILENALNKEISSDIPNLTYGIVILNTLDEMKIVNSIPGSSWTPNPQIDSYFKRMSEINVWAEMGSIISKKILTEAAGPAGVITLMMPELFKVGINIAMLVKNYKKKVFWWYFQERSFGTESKEAFFLALEVGSFPVGGMPGIYVKPNGELTDKGQTTLELLELLWRKYQNGYDPGKGGLKEEYKIKYKKELKEFLIGAISDSLLQKGNFKSKMDWKKYTIGALGFSFPAHWEVEKRTGGMIVNGKWVSNNKDTILLAYSFKDRGKPMVQIATQDVPFPGKFAIIHSGMDGGEKITEYGTTSYKYHIAHMGYLVRSFKSNITDREILVCVLNLFPKSTPSLNKNVSIKERQINYSFCLIEGGKLYHFSLLTTDSLFQEEIFKKLASRICLRK